MSAATIAPEDLSWVTWGTEDDEPCHGRHGIPCDLQAVAQAVWEETCEHWPNPHRLCVSHRDETAEDVRDCRWFRCSYCGARMFLLRIEPLR